MTVRRLFVALAVVMVLVTTAGLGTAAAIRRSDTRATWDDDRVLTVLLLGSDIGPPNRPGNPLHGRADAIHLVAVDTKRKRATVVDIPRDSYIAGSKVNEHLSSAGPDGIAAVMEDYTAVNVDYWAVTSFRGLKGIVNAVGGVEITVSSAMDDANSRAHLSAGRQRLSGSDALAFSRNRYDLPDGDFGRTHNQGRLLRAIHRTVRRDHVDLLSLTRLIAAFSRNVETNVPPRQLFRIASLAVSVKPRHVKQLSLSGGVGSAGGASIVHLNPGDAFSDIRNGHIGR